MSRKWNLPLTYPPKIEPVKAGTCRQTIRVVEEGKPKKEVGDLVRFYIWEGVPEILANVRPDLLSRILNYWWCVPYRSKRRTITEYAPLKEVHDRLITPNGFQGNDTYGKLGMDFDPWHNLNDVAFLDGIIPPTGEALRDVLMSKNKIPASGIEAQILRW